ncbi:MAG: VWA domain-containing protein, partial [Acidobacteria bacterium]|nr:VWA domain-containing protein [Acidobacteriota bacterium]
MVLLRPADGAMLIGPVEIAFLPQGIEDADVRSASVTIDGREVALVSEPPWRATVDVGEAIVARRIEVTLTLADGRSLRAGRTYPAAAAIQRVDVRLVNLSVNVADRRGNPLPGLGREAFTVFDQGVPVPIERFSAQPDGLSIALVIDASGSMLGDRLDAARDAAAAFVEQLADEDRVAVVRFSDDVQTVAALGTNRETAAAAVRGLTSSGGTALHDAIVRTAEELARSELESRRAIVLLSDGRDEAASGLEPGSFHTLDEAIRAAHLADARSMRSASALNS